MRMLLYFSIIISMYGTNVNVFGTSVIFYLCLETNIFIQNFPIQFKISVRQTQKCLASHKMFSSLIGHSIFSIHIGKFLHIIHLQNSRIISMCSYHSFTTFISGNRKQVIVVSFCKNTGIAKFSTAGDAGDSFVGYF